jgi:hypothetical protein
VVGMISEIRVLLLLRVAMLPCCSCWWRENAAGTLQVGRGRGVDVHERGLHGLDAASLVLHEEMSEQGERGEVDQLSMDAPRHAAQRRARQAFVALLAPPTTLLLQLPRTAGQLCMLLRETHCFVQLHETRSRRTAVREIACTSAVGPGALQPIAAAPSAETRRAATQPAGTAALTGV